MKPCWTRASLLPATSSSERARRGLERRAKGNFAMDILKFVLLAIIRLAVCGVLKVALVVYILFLPNSPLGGVAPGER
jgi:hypothetical protein